MKSIVILSLVLAVEAGQLERVVQGSAAKGQFPYMVLLTYEYDRFACSGVIIGKNWVLTAAHCVLSASFVYYPKAYVIAGPNSMGNTKIHHSIEKFIIHDEYFPGCFNNDIALAKVHTPFEYNQYVNEIPLNPKFIEGGVQAELVGFGIYNFLYDGDLHWTKVSVVSNEECRRTNPIHNAKQHICAVYKKSGECYVDSGSPLVYNKTLIGVLSYINGLCGSGIPDGYMRISTYYNWIQRTTKKSHSRFPTERLV